MDISIRFVASTGKRTRLSRVGLVVSCTTWMCHFVKFCLASPKFVVEFLNHNCLIWTQMQHIHWNRCLYSRGDFFSVKLTPKFSWIFIKSLTNFVQFCVTWHVSSACSLGVCSRISFSTSFHLRVLVFGKCPSPDFFLNLWTHYVYF